MNFQEQQAIVIPRKIRDTIFVGIVNDVPYQNYVVMDRASRNAVCLILVYDAADALFQSVGEQPSKDLIIII